MSDYRSETTSAVEPVLALVRDLMFAGKISAEGRAAGVEVKIIRDPATLRIHGGTRLLVDLNLEGAIEAAAEWKSRVAGGVVGFVSHVDQATIEKARAAGLEIVLARSQFVAQLAKLLGEK